MPENKTMKLKDGRKLGYALYGDPKGKPLFFFHGWPGSRLRAQITDKVAKKLHIHIISPDRPGYGLSDFKKNRTLLDWPRDVKELADHLKIKSFSIIGVSGGGPYAAVCGYSMPYRVKKVGIVVGLGPSTIPHAFEGTAKLNKFAWEHYGHIPFFTRFSAWLSLLESRYFPQVITFAYKSDSDRKLLTRKVKDELKISMREAYKQGSKGPMRDLEIYTSDWGFDIINITQPTFLWYGEDDKNVSLNMGRYYASRIPKSTLVIYPHEGHMVSKTHALEIAEKMI